MVSSLYFSTLTMIQINNILEENFRKNELWKLGNKLKHTYKFFGIIYMYTFKDTGKKYIGQTVDPWERHKSHLGVSFRPSSSDYKAPFHCAIRKYGSDNIEYTILAIVTSEISHEDVKLKLDKKEKYYIKKYNSGIHQNGYNIQEGGTAIAFKQSSRNCKVDQYTIDGEYIQTFDTYAEAARQIKGIARVIKGAVDKKGVGYGYRWALHGTTLEMNIVDRSVYQYDQDGNFMAEYSGTFEAARITNCPYSSIRMAVLNKFRMSGGYYWRDEKYDVLPFEDFPEAVCQYDLDGNFVTWYHNVNEAVHKVNASGSTAICTAINRKQRYHNFLWRREKLNRINPDEGRVIREVHLNAVYPDGTIQYYRNMVEAAKGTGVDLNQVKRSVKGLPITKTNIKFCRI